MRYYLYREDGEGDSGGMSMTFLSGADVEIKHDARPEVGRQIRVGSISARSYQYQDWWQTSPILEIIDDMPDKVVFKTRSATYTWSRR